LSSPLVLDVGDRFVIRESGRGQTVAGGIVVDVDPPGRPGPDAAARPHARLEASREELPGLLVTERGAVRASEVPVLTGARQSHVDGARRTGAWWVAEPVRTRVEQAVRDHLERFHVADPLAAGDDVTALRPSVVAALGAAGAPADPGLAEALLDDLVMAGSLVREGSLIRVATHIVTTPDEEGARLLAAVEGGEPTPPTVPELLALGFGRSLIDATVRLGTLVRVSAEIVHTAGFVARAVEAIREAGADGVTVSALRERLGTSRRFAVPLVEHLDRTGVTRRSGDVRILRER
jgi:selenocysteine-specific elongation factor